MGKQLNTEMINYIEKEIFPIYETFDKGHDLSHINAVINRALILAKEFDDLNINIVYAAAALHDIGVKVQRKNHAYYSKIFVEEDNNLKKYFSDDEIEIIADAVEDHSTSKGIEPRSIYGKIICDADKDDDLETSLLRAYEFTKKYYEDYNEEECINNVYNQLKFKFGEEGKVKFWINTKEQQEFLNKMKSLASNKELFDSMMKEIIEKHPFKMENENVQKLRIRQI